MAVPIRIAAVAAHAISVIFGFAGDGVGSNGSVRKYGQEKSGDKNGYAIIR